MKTIALVAFAMSLGLSAAQAGNDVVLLPAGELANGTQLVIDGDVNRLVILQGAVGGGTDNSLQVTLSGDGNGGPAGSAFDPIAAADGLQPGSLIQQGSSNLMTIDVAGSGNLFAASQIGDGNTLHGSIAGYGNQAVVRQIGAGNIASFSQNGIGNIVSISQYN